MLLVVLILVRPGGAMVPLAVMGGGPLLLPLLLLLLLPTHKPPTADSPLLRPGPRVSNCWLDVCGRCLDRLGLDSTFAGALAQWDPGLGLRATTTLLLLLELLVPLLPLLLACALRMASPGPSAEPSGG